MNVSRTLSKKSDLINKTITRLLLEEGVNEAYLTQEISHKAKIKRISFEHIYKEYAVPSKFPLRNFQARLKSALRGIRCDVTKSQIDFKADRNVLDASIAYKGYEIFSLKLKQKIPAKKVSYKEPPLLKPYTPAYIAIVIDDWGYSLRNLDSLFQIGKSLTVAILPNLQYSQSIAKQMSARNIEIILHLPLEPHNKNAENEKDTIFTHMDKQQILTMLDSCIKNVPYIKGISNHQGSKATEDKALMKIIFDELKKRNLFFLDSFVTTKSICENVARQTGIRFAKRATFIDNEEDPDYIKTQLRHLVYIAKRDGAAIGICHDRPVTISVLKETMDEFEREGIQFVKLSSLVK
ncbi:MAG: divergent polysaccharide deacetylase family protein [Candidatus Omnitrophota bacterium]